jgi:predicted ATPase
MQLKKARVLNYRSVEDSGEFTLDRVTCLVGKNESGKTALLQALYKLNPYGSGATFDVERDYPRRHSSDFAERHPGGKAVAVRTWWTLESDDTKALTDVLGPEGEKITEVEVTKGYGTDRVWSIEVDEAAVTQHVLATSGLHAEELGAFAGFATIKDVKTHIASLGAAATPRHQALAAKLEKDFKRGTASLAAIDALELPTFVYFSQYQRMPGQVPVDALLGRKAQKTLSDDDQVFIALCNLAGTSLEDIQKLQQFEPVLARFEGASNKISAEIFRYWRQNRHLKVQFRIDAALPGDPAPLNTGRIVRTRIWNTLHDVSVPFDERSTGFVWFFSFIALFSQVRRSHGDNLVILLDEPGLSLHAKAQGDLLRYVDERLAPKHQVIYTTHSPFMVSVDRITSVRTVEDVVVRNGEDIDVRGTKVGDDVLSTDRDTLFPLQGALGYELTQSLFVGEHTLLVEGPSDILYLKAASAELQARGRTGLDRRWIICPAGGVEKVTAFMSLFGGNRLHVAVFIDYAHGHKKKVEDLRRSSLLRSGHVFTAEAYAGLPEADVEDLLGASTYVDLVNRCYELTAEPVAVPQGTGRIVKFVEEQLRPRASPDFDHYAPAMHLFENRNRLFRSLPEADAALKRFEALFRDLNTLLPRP